MLRQASTLLSRRVCNTFALSSRCLHASASLFEETKTPDTPPRPDLMKMRPETLAMTYAYVPGWSENSLKPPLFQTSTFVFSSAEDGKAFFEVSSGQKEQDPNKGGGLIYSRINNPDLEIVENRINLWDKGGAAAVFGSGMGAIATAVQSFAFPGTSVVFARPVYGGTDTLFSQVLPERGVTTRNFLAGTDPADVDKMMTELDAEGKPCKVLFVETPANPTMVVTDIEVTRAVNHTHSVVQGMAKVAKRHGALLMVDNTFLGPLYQSPLELGADVVLYSATKYLGGHSDICGGVAVAAKPLMKKIKKIRSTTGTTMDPNTAWLLMRSLETLDLRMRRAQDSASIIADWLAAHPMIDRVVYPSMFEGEQKKIFDNQCKGTGGMVTFYLKDPTEAAAFRFLNHVKVIKLAVSLGGTESLIQHPATMTHADVPKEEQEEIGLNSALVRLSVGMEHPEDLKAALDHALAFCDPHFEDKGGYCDEVGLNYLKTFYYKK